MKKMLSTLLFTGVLLGATLAPALAEVASYKVYDPKTNKAYAGVLNTVGIGSNDTYVYGFVGKSDSYPLCAITSLNDTNVKNGLVGGQCIDFIAISKAAQGVRVDFNNYILGWRELKPNTLNKEVREIRSERAQDGMYEYKGDWVADMQK